MSYKHRSRLLWWYTWLLNELSFSQKSNLLQHPAYRKPFFCWVCKEEWLHFHAFDLDAPGIGGVIQWILHDVADRFSLRQNFRQIFGAQYISKGGGRQQTSWMAAIRRIVVSTEFENHHFWSKTKYFFHPISLAILFRQKARQQNQTFSVSAQSQNKTLWARARTSRIQNINKAK